MGALLEAINIFLWLYGIVFAFIALFGYAVQRNKERGYLKGTKIDPKDITVLIPFRNEGENLPMLIESIKKLRVLPKAFIFIDDASEDNSAELLTTLNDDFPITVLRKGGSLPGKKHAIRVGAKIVESEYTLTWDADVTVPSDYFEAISNLSEADMYVLPVIFKASNFLERLFSFDVVVANAVNAGVSGWRRPIFASGANLLYRTKLFNELDSIESHGHISSGDDTFLLRDFVAHNKNVRLCTEPELAVSTPAPSNFKVYISQRLRWVSKTNALGDPLNTIVALGQLVFMIAFVVLIVWTLTTGHAFPLVYLLICKVLTDVFVFGSYFKQMRQIGLLLLLPIAELWFPLYSILLAVLIPFYKPSWKGREVISK